MPNPQRVTWVDVARGIAIVAVVVYHAALFLNEIGLGGPWWPAMKVLETFRMPLFFFVSGLFAAKIRTQGLRTLWSRRIALYLYLYVLWSLIRVVYFQFVPFVLPGGDASDWRNFALIFFWPSGGLWFIYALAIFSLFVWLLRRAPAWVPIGISVVVSVLFGSAIIEFDNEPWMKTGTYIAFFVSAVYLREHALAFAERVRPLPAIALTVVYLGAALAFTQVDIARDIVGVRMLVSILGVAAGISIAVLLARVRLLDGLQSLGRNTLPIYLVHYLPIAAAAAVLAALDLPETTAWKLVLTPTLTVLGIAIALVLHRLLGHVPGIFDLPRRRTTAGGPTAPEARAAEGARPAGGTRTPSDRSPRS